MNKLIDGFCGNHKTYKEILLWLQNFNYDKKISTDSCIIVSGTTCIGKTFTINDICNYLNYDIMQTLICRPQPYDILVCRFRIQLQPYNYFYHDQKF